MERLTLPSLHPLASPRCRPRSTAQRPLCRAVPKPAQPQPPVATAQVQPLQQLRAFVTQLSPEQAAGAAVGCATLLLLLLSRRRGSGSVDGLVSRGVGLAAERGLEGDKYYDKMMESVRTVKIEALSDEEIEAARERRRAANAAADAEALARRGGGAEAGPAWNAASELRSIAVPKNHPYATSKVTRSPEEEARKREEVLALNRRRSKREEEDRG